MPAGVGLGGLLHCTSESCPVTAGPSLAGVRAVGCAAQCQGGIGTASTAPSAGLSASLYGRYGEGSGFPFEPPAVVEACFFQISHTFHLQSHSHNVAGDQWQFALSVVIQCNYSSVVTNFSLEIYSPVGFHSNPNEAHLVQQLVIFLSCHVIN